MLQGEKGLRALHGQGGSEVLNAFVSGLLQSFSDHMLMT